jgi:hypothetical protein
LTFAVTFYDLTKDVSSHHHYSPSAAFIEASFAVGVTALYVAEELVK